MLAVTSIWHFAAVPSCTSYPERCIPLSTLTGTALMPVVALGTWRGSYKECIGNDYACVRAKAKASVMSWVDVKGDHVDTANNYRTQLEVGEALAQKGVKREDIFITTKCPGPLGLTATIQCAEDNLQMLGLYGVNTTGYLDLLLIHYPNVIKPECYGPSSDPDIQKECAGTGQFQDPGTAARQETWKAMELLQKLGRVKSIGFSNCTTNLARAALIGTAPPCHINTFVCALSPLADNSTHIAETLAVATVPIALHQVHALDRPSDHLHAAHRSKGRNGTR